VKSIRTSRDFAVPVAEAEALWYDLDRWPAFIDGFHHIEKRDGDWPRQGSSIAWQSFPGGRGRVLEQVTGYAPRDGQTAEIDDDEILGTRRVRFQAREDGVRIELALEYELKDRSLIKVIAEPFFIRRAMRDSLRRELTRFGRELEADRALAS
jgi:uncharacterized membrane protein